MDTGRTIHCGWHCMPIHFSAFATCISVSHFVTTAVAVELVCQKGIGTDIGYAGFKWVQYESKKHHMPPMFCKINLLPSPPPSTK